MIIHLLITTRGYLNSAKGRLRNILQHGLTMHVRVPYHQSGEDILP